MIDMYVREDPEDPPEPFKSPQALLNDWNPLNRLEDRLDTEKIITTNNFSLYLLSEDYWHPSQPFQGGLDAEPVTDIYMSGQIEAPASTHSYIPDFSPNKEPSFRMDYSAVQPVSYQLPHEEDQELDVSSNTEIDKHEPDENLRFSDPIDLAIDSVKQAA